MNVGDFWMPIQCRTGCKEQVNYEHFPFSDGFVYLLPKNLDETIHDCKKFSENSYKKIN